MKRTSVLDFLGVARILGYSLALVAAAVAVALYLLGFRLPVLRVFAPELAGPILLGLAVAWVAGLSRVFARRMRFATPQD